MINTIIFDFGGVLGTNSDPNFIKILVKKGIKKHKAIEIWEKHWPDLKSGEERVSEFWSDVANETKLDIKKMEKEYNEGIEVHEDVLEFYKKLKANGYKLGILSNESFD